MKTDRAICEATAHGCRSLDAEGVTNGTWGHATAALIMALRDELDSVIAFPPMQKSTAYSIERMLLEAEARGERKYKERAEKAEAALAEARKDAERYRKLKAMFDHGGVTIRLIGEVDKLGIPLVTYEYTEWEPLQSAIDAARGQP